MQGLRLSGRLSLFDDGQLVIGLVTFPAIRPARRGNEGTDLMIETKDSLVLVIGNAAVTA
jgi:hypothetical protein